MSARLEHIQNWDELAWQANWSASELAEHCGVSLSTLKRHFNCKMWGSPKSWLTENRQRLAREMLGQRLTVKEVAAALGYKHARQFSREFKNFWGFSPTKNAPCLIKNGE